MHTGGKGSNSSYSPSFNSYFNPGLAVIAARVSTEFPEDSDNGAVVEETDDFEFDLSNLMAGDGEIRPVYPVFNRDLLRDSDLQSLLVEERRRSGADLDPPSSSSSSEADETEDVPAGAYCVWAPVGSASPGRCMKSNSTGSCSRVRGKAKSWKLREFLKRSKSDGKQGLVVADGSRGRGREGAGETNCKRKSSYLPYRQDLVALFATPNAFRKMHSNIKPKLSKE